MPSPRRVASMPRAEDRRRVPTPEGPCALSGRTSPTSTTVDLAGLQKPVVRAPQALASRSRWNLLLLQIWCGAQRQPRRHECSPAVPAQATVFAGLHPWICLDLRMSLPPSAVSPASTAPIRCVLGYE